jgi:hypothetical protein
MTDILDTKSVSNTELTVWWTFCGYNVLLAVFSLLTSLDKKGRFNPPYGEAKRSQQKSPGNCLEKSLKNIWGPDVPSRVAWFLMESPSWVAMIICFLVAWEVRCVVYKRKPVSLLVSLVKTSHETKKNLVCAQESREVPTASYVMGAAFCLHYLHRSCVYGIPTLSL